MRPKVATACPSGRCRPGAVLIGVVGPDGRLGPVLPPLPLDAEFVARAGATAEARFRFSEPCAEDRCGHWADGRCGLVDAVVDQSTGTRPRAALPRCGIRARCRWFDQRGTAACTVCPLVVRDRHAAPAPA